MTTKAKDFKFIDKFRTQGCADLAVSIVADKQQAGYSYKQILNYPGFTELFDPIYLQGRNIADLEVQLKNMVRDIRECKRPMSPVYSKARNVFLARKRGRNKNKHISVIMNKILIGRHDTHDYV